MVTSLMEIRTTACDLDEAAFRSVCTELRKARPSSRVFRCSLGDRRGRRPEVNYIIAIAQQPPSAPFSRSRQALLPASSTKRAAVARLCALRARNAAGRWVLPVSSAEERKVAASLQDVVDQWIDYLPITSQASRSKTPSTATRWCRHANVRCDRLSFASCNITASPLDRSTTRTDPSPAVGRIRA